MSDEDIEVEEGGSAPDFTNASEVCKWFGRETIRLIGQARREKSLSRLRALSGAIDSWSRLHRLASDTTELASLRSELAELRTMIEAERKTGPAGVVR